MHKPAHNLYRFILTSLLFLTCSGVHSWELKGNHTVELINSSGAVFELGTLNVSDVGNSDEYQFDFHFNDSTFEVYFLSMRNFDCVTGEKEVFCHVVYPYDYPTRVSENNLTWLEHSFLFMHKSASEFSAKLWNGIIYNMEITEEGIIGHPQAVDLNEISSPPEPGIAPYGDGSDTEIGERAEIDPKSREFVQLRIR